MGAKPLDLNDSKRKNQSNNESEFGTENIKYNPVVPHNTGRWVGRFEFVPISKRCHSEFVIPFTKGP
ncbi:MAG: hypothetical protein RL608_1235 [Bacteroidota bacterium]